MKYYTYNDYFCFDNMTDTSNEHHNNLIINQIPYHHITSLFKLMDDIFELLPNLFVDKCNKRMESYVQIVAKLSNVNVWDK